MNKILKNLEESFEMCWNNPCGVNKVILFILMLLTFINGAHQAGQDISWLIDKIF